MVAARMKKAWDSGVCFWKSPTGGIILAGLLIPLSIFSYKAYAWAVLTDKEVANLHEATEEHREALIVQSDSIKAVSERSLDNCDSIELLKMQLQEEEDQTEILEALYYSQTGNEWEGGD